jgi:hypothetical protein
LRIFLDANIIFSAAKSDGAVRLLLGMLRRAGHECWADPYVVEEARRNLTLKLPDGPASLDRELRHLHVAPRHTVDTALASALPIAEKDRPVLAAAIRLRCSAFLAGDRTHFGALFGKTLHGVTIHSPRSIAETLRSGGLPRHSL